MASPNAKEGPSPNQPAAHRSLVGPPHIYDLVSEMQFNLLTLLGLREEHTLLDIGCGSLRGGRLFIVYLQPGHYFGLEPDVWLVQQGIEKELGQEIIQRKRPHFSHDRNFTCTVFRQEFDFLLAQAIFSHAAPGQIRRCLAEARKCMKPTSLFAATFFEGEENYTGSEWVYPACVTYQFSWLADAAAESGLRCTCISWYHPAQQTWVLFSRPENQAVAEALGKLDEPLLLPAQLRSCQEALRNYQRRLARLEAHPYVRAGRFVRRLLRKFTGHR